MHRVIIIKDWKEKMKVYGIVYKNIFGSCGMGWAELKKDAEVLIYLLGIDSFVASAFWRRSQWW